MKMIDDGETDTKINSRHSDVCRVNHIQNLKYLLYHI
ncbi:hypothetical protein [Mycoplasmopsis bovirhinis]